MEMSTNYACWTDFERSLINQNNLNYHTLILSRKILRDIPDLSYAQPKGNYYFKTSDSYQILKSCYIILR